MGFLKDGGGGIISSVISGGLGLLGQSLASRQQERLQERAFEQSKEMAEIQNQYEVDRMGLQASMNRDAADYSQRLAKDMWEYTGYGGQIRQMRDAGLNPSLMYGGGGGGGQSTSGGSQQGVTAIQPMGLTVALQARQQAAQIELIEAQAAKTKAETLQTSTLGAANSALDLISKNIQNKATKKNIEKADNEIANIKLTNDQISTNIDNMKKTGKLQDFEIWINDLKKNASFILDNGAKVTFKDLFGMNVIKGLQKEWEQLNLDITKIDFDNNVLVGLFNNLEKIIKGEVDGYQVNSKKYEQMDWDLQNDKAFGDLLNSLEIDNKYSKLILGIIRYFANKK